MTQTVGDFFRDRLYQWGVCRVFGYPGDGINGLLGAAPLPPHITLQQAKTFASTIVKGDPEEKSMIIDTAKERLSGVLPGRRS